MAALGMAGPVAVHTVHVSSAHHTALNHRFRDEVSYDPASLARKKCQSCGIWAPVGHECRLCGELVKGALPRPKSPSLRQHHHHHRPAGSMGAALGAVDPNAPSRSDDLVGCGFDAWAKKQEQQQQPAAVRSRTPVTNSHPARRTVSPRCGATDRSLRGLLRDDPAKRSESTSASSAMAAVARSRSPWYARKSQHSAVPAAAHASRSGSTASEATAAMHRQRQRNAHHPTGDHQPSRSASSMTMADYQQQYQHEMTSYRQVAAAQQQHRSVSAASATDGGARTSYGGFRQAGPASWEPSAAQGGTSSRSVSSQSALSSSTAASQRLRSGSAAVKVPCRCCAGPVVPGHNCPVCLTPSRA